MKQLIRMFVILLIVPSLTGCFYLMEAGAGGAAERYALEPELDLENTKRNYFDEGFIESNKRYIARIKECDRVILNHKSFGLSELHPALYVEIENLLVVS